MEAFNAAGLSSAVKVDTSGYGEYDKERKIGSWWEVKGKANEIDIFALSLQKHMALAVEIKRQRDRYRPTVFADKVERLKQTTLQKNLLPVFRRYVKFICN